MKQPESIDDVINQIKSNGTLKEVLTPEYFARNDWAAHKVAKYIIDAKRKEKTEMKVNQLRKFFESVKSLEDILAGKKGELKEVKKFFPKFYMLFPELAYAKGRRLIAEKFYQLMKEALSDGKVKFVEDYKILVEFLSAILAYHKMESETKTKE